MRTLLASLGAFAAASLLSTASLAAPCTDTSGHLGVSRAVEIDTTGGPGFGLQHYKAYDFLQPKEVVLTFDDGPLPKPTRTVLAALDAECVKATFFSVGKQAAASPEVLRELAASGHTIGSHTNMHKDLSKLSGDKLTEEIELAVSAVRIAVGDKAAPFFRFPYLKDSQASLKYLASRNIGIFSTDIDSRDFVIGTPSRLVDRVMKKLKEKGKGILLFHDMRPVTSKAIPELLQRLKKDGYKIVHLKAKAPATSLPEFDKQIMAKFKGRADMAGGRPMSSVIKSVPVQ